MEWKPIETLRPASGEVLLFYPGEAGVYGRPGHRPMWRVGRNDVPRKPTHWMPLPTPPAPTSRDGDREDG